MPSSKFPKLLNYTVNTDYCGFQNPPAGFLQHQTTMKPSEGIWSSLGPNLNFPYIGMESMVSQNTSNLKNVLGSSSRQNIMSHLVSKIPKKFQHNTAQRSQSKVKRLNQENKPRLRDLIVNFKRNNVKTKKSHKTIEEKTYEDCVPIKALYCHMCDLGDFGSISDYISHMKGTNHTANVKAYSIKFTSNMEMFRNEARIASESVIAEAPQNINQRIVYCQKCQCNVSDDFGTHGRSSEHLQVLNYLGVKCCGVSFNSRIDLEEHWLSLQHTHYKCKLFVKYIDQGFTLQNEEDMLKLSMKATAEPHHDVATWPAFDPTVPIGLRYVDIGVSNKCSVCCEYLEAQAVVILNHCCSSKHYHKMCIFFKYLQNNTIQISSL